MPGSREAVGGGSSSPRIERGGGSAETQDNVRTSSSDRALAQATARSRGRGCNGHRILRRVPVGGRHLGSSRTSPFHEGAVTATSAPCSGEVRYGRSTAATGRRAKARPHSAETRRDRGVRGTFSAGAVGRKRPRPEHAHHTGATPQRGKHGCARPAESRRSGLECRETLGPPVSPTEPKTPRGVHAARAAERTGNARGTGARGSSRWQKSVDRIARSNLRSIARGFG